MELIIVPPLCRETPVSQATDVFFFQSGYAMSNKVARLPWPFFRRFWQFLAIFRRVWPFFCCFSPLKNKIKMLRDYLPEADPELEHVVTFAVGDFFFNLVNLNKIWIVIKLFRLIWHRTKFRLVTSYSENGKYNLNSVNLIRKPFNVRI